MHRNKIVSIAILFCVSIIVKSIYEWFMYYQYELRHKRKVLIMMQVEATIMPLFWDVMPVSLIYYLHKYNFEDKPL